ncbi:hypothetical protein B0H66DRAFT_507303 [Apodospora peruviana]|uniref:Dimethylaniline monooxygenase n=1 Tax=Apodospora peruviana TaxID=516989 RepID=A0AAE0MH38_9PEZI|nr:hypothetical protein B0H66DRAFT_507303 [Apodospora peruviana]
MRVAVIGAGPSGLATLKYLQTAHRFLETDQIEAVLFEAEDAIGGTFAHRTYEDAELVSSKQLTTFSDFRPRKDDPDFLSTARYVEYLNDYCDHFGLRPHIKLSSPVVSVRRSPAGGHIVSYKPTDNEVLEYSCDAIASFHSADFKSKSQFSTDKTVLILGSGETGMDLGYMAVNSPTKRVLLSHRDGFLCAPKRVPDPVILPILGNKPDPNHLNVPVDSSSASLFDTAYVHRRLRDHMLLWEYYDFFIKSTLWLVGGSKYGLAQHVGGISEGRYHASKIFFNKSNKAMPYISAPYRDHAESCLTQRIRSSLIQVPIADTNGRRIDLAPWPERIDSKGVVHFRDNGRKEYGRLRNETIKPDIVIFATGYRQTFPFFNMNAKDETDTDGNEYDYPTPGEVDVRDIWHSSDPTVGYIGFVRPSFGAIPPLAEMQAQLWILNLISPHQLAGKLNSADEPQYRLLVPETARIHYGVDHESYAYQLAVDMNSAPSFTDVIKAGWAYPATMKGKDGREMKTGGWYRLPLVWALGANFNAKFRLRGPWAWDGASEVLVDELWDTIERRGGFFGHVTLSGVPMLVFGTISLVLWLIDPLLKLFEARKTMVVSGVRKKTQ